MGVCDVPVISSVCDAVGEATATLISAPFDWLAHAAGAAASWLFQGVWGLFDTTTLIDLSSAGYVGVYNIMFGIAVFLMLIFFCFQLLTALIRREPGALSHAGVGLAKSVLGSFIALAVMALLLEVVDQLTIGIVQATGNTMEDMGANIGLLIAGLAGISIADPGAGAIITIFLAFLAIAAGAIVWFSLLIRKSLVLVGVVLAPIALSGLTWEKARGWFPKWASFLVALIVSKLVVMVIFLVAITQVNAPIDFDLASIADPVAGIVLMFVAAFAPYMVYKFIAFAGFDTYQLTSAEHEAKQALNRPLPISSSPPVRAQQILDGTQSGGGDSKPAPPSTEPNDAAQQSTSTSTGPSSSGAEAESVSPSATQTGTAGAGGGTAAGGGAAAAAGPIVAGVMVAKAAADAGPQLGEAIGQAAGTQADQALPSQDAPVLPSAPEPAAGGPDYPPPSATPQGEDPPPPARTEVPTPPPSAG